MSQTATHRRINGLSFLSAAIGLAFLAGCTEQTQTTPQEHTTNKPVFEEDVTPYDTEPMNNQSTTAQDVREKADEAFDATADYAAQTKEEIEQSMKEQLAEIDTRIEELESRAGELNESAREEFDEQLANLKEQREEYAKSFQEFQEESGDAWEDMRSGLADAWSELKSAADKAGDQFND